MINKYLNKINISLEAKFDYEECLKLGQLPKSDIQKNIEQYLSISGSRLKEYFRVKYLDEKADVMLMLFIKKQHMFSSMIIWKIYGICREIDYDDDFEHRGINRAWYESLINTAGQSKIDWVKELGGNIQTKTHKITGLSKGATNAFYHSGN